MPLPGPSSVSVKLGLTSRRLDGSTSGGHRHVRSTHVARVSCCADGRERTRRRRSKQTDARGRERTGPEGRKAHQARPRTPKVAEGGHRRHPRGTLPPKKRRDGYVQENTCNVEERTWMRRQFGKSYGTWMVRWWAKEEEGYGPSRKEKKTCPAYTPNGLKATRCVRLCST